MTTQLVVTGGRDSCGSFNIELPGKCDYCGEVVDAVVVYRSWTNEIKIGTTLLKSRKRKLGITCGHYAALCRQIAHISDRSDA